MADVVLDANLLVGLLDRNDSLHQRATELVDRMRRMAISQSCSM